MQNKRKKQKRIKERKNKGKDTRIKERTKQRIKEDKQ